MSGSQVSDLKVLKNMEGLNKLNLDLSYESQKINNISILRELNNLTSLELVVGPKVHDISVLKYLNNLTLLSLDFRNSKISDIKILKEVTAKEIRLDLSYSDIKSLQDLPSCSATITLSGRRQLS